MKTLKVALLSLIFISCATSPLGRKQLRLVPDAQIDELGQQAFLEMKQKLKLSQNERELAYVRCVVGHLLEKIDGTQPAEWEIQVFQEPTPNAFALPGRRIGVHTGMMKVAVNQNQLAAVLGHGIAHVLAQHGNERVSQAMAVQGAVGLAGAVLDLQGPKRDLLMAALGLGVQVGVLLPYSRIQETEADLIGLKLMAEAGFEPGAAVKLWENMREYGGGQPPEFLSTHPAHQTRIDKLQAHLPEAQKIYQQASKAKKPQCGASL